MQVGSVGGRGGGDAYTLKFKFLLFFFFPQKGKRHYIYSIKVYKCTTVQTMSASLPKVNKAQNKQRNEDSSFPPKNKIINCKLTSNVITTRTLHIYMKQKKKKKRWLFV